MSQHLHVSLTDEDRQHLEGLIRRGSCPARVQTRARILLLSDRSSGEKRSRQAVAVATLCNAVTVGNVCRRFVQEGREAALTTNVFDNENRLVQVQAAAGLSTYGYDGDGLRRHAQEPGAANPTTFIWDGSDYLGEYGG